MCSYFSQEAYHNRPKRNRPESYRKLQGLRKKVKRLRNEQESQRIEFENTVKNLVKNLSKSELIISASQYMTGYQLELFKALIEFHNQNKGRRFSNAMKTLALSMYFRNGCPMKPPTSRINHIFSHFHMSK